MLEIYRFGDVSVLVFLGSVVVALWLAIRCGVQALRGARDRALRSAGYVAAVVAVYAAALSGLSLATPRQIIEPGGRHCFDDWCVGAEAAAPLGPEASAACQSPAGTRAWTVTLRVSNRGRGRRQRARDAAAMLEDQSGRQSPPCPNPLPSSQPAPRLSDEVSAGESFDVPLVFARPGGATPAGVVVSHGAFPDVLIIGADQGFLHPRALLRVKVTAPLAP